MLINDEAEAADEERPAIPYITVEVVDIEPRASLALKADHDVVQLEVQMGSLGSSHSSWPTIRLSPHIDLHIEGRPEQFQPIST